MRDALYLVALVALTSAGALLVGRRWGLAPQGLRPALSRLMEWVGLAALFYAINLMAGFLAVLAMRRVTSAFVSVYVNTDSTLAVLSALQAVAWQWWRASSPRS